ncbi:hypothetical protein [Proteus columbae]|uniref:hypothetical protein n=1 Tax=Proteus columbae TaxID=1987580 RepID=UPI00288A8A8C|nr:hypothetical protein [Proteus columbae]
MVATVTEELEKLAKEMEESTPENESGISVNDLINASDTADGKIVFDEVDENLIETIKHVDQEVVKEEPTKDQPTIVEEPIEEVQTPKQISKAEEPVEDIQEIDVFDDQANHVLEPDTQTLCNLTGFRPTINLMGSGRGFYTCPWWH